MVKFTVWNEDRKCENQKFTRELNTYGYDANGMGLELLFPIRLNAPSGGNLEINLATYLVKYMEFERTSVKIKIIKNKEWFKQCRLIFLKSNNIYRLCRWVIFYFRKID